MDKYNTHIARNQDDRIQLDILNRLDMLIDINIKLFNLIEHLTMKSSKRDKKAPKIDSNKKKVK